MTKLHRYYVPIEAICAWWGHVEVVAESAVAAQTLAYASRDKWVLDKTGEEPLDPSIYYSDIEELEDEEGEEE